MPALAGGPYLSCLENKDIAAIVCSVNNREFYRVVGTFFIYGVPNSMPGAGPCRPHQYSCVILVKPSRQMTWYNVKEDHKLYLLLDRVMAQIVMCQPVTSEFSNAEE